MSPRRLYYLIQASDGIAMAMITTLNMVYLVTVVGLDPLQLVLVGTVLEISYFAFEIPTGIVADLYSRKWSVVAGLVLIGGGFILEGSIPVYGWVLASQVLFGIGATFTSGAYEAWVATETSPGDGGLNHLFLRGSQVRQAAAFVGIGAAVALGSEDVSIPIVVGGSMLVTLGVVLTLVMPETGFQPGNRSDESAWRRFREGLVQGARQLRERRPLIAAAAIMLAWGGAAEGFDRLWTPLLIDNYEFTPVAGLASGLVARFGFIRAGGMALSIFGAEVARRATGHEDAELIRRATAITMMILVAAIVGLALAPGLALAIGAVWLFSAARNVLDTLVTTWVSLHSSRERRATILSAVRQATSLGELSIGPGLGWVARTVSIPAALFGSAGMAGLGLTAWRRISADR